MPDPVEAMSRTQAHPTLPQVRKFKEAAESSGIPYTSLRDAYFRGELAVVMIGRAWYVDVAELARFVERHTRRHQQV